MSSIPLPRTAALPIRAKLILLILACCLPILIGYAMLTLDADRREQRHVANDARTVATVLAAAMDRSIDAGAAAAHVLAHSSELARGDLAGFHATARRLLTPDFPAEAATLSKPDGTVLLDTRHPYGARLTEPAHVMSVRQAAATGTALATGLHQLDPARQTGLSVKYPVRRAGKVAYVLSIELRNQRLAALFEGQMLPQDWIGEIYDPRLHLATRSAASPAFFDGPMAHIVHKALSRAEHGTIDTRPDGKTAVYTAFARAPKHGWVVAIHYPHNAADVLLGKPVSMLVGAVMALVALGVGLAWLLGGHIGRGVRALAQPATTLGTGEPVQFAASGIQEVDTVAAALMRADAELRESRRQLEARVAERTSEVERSRAQLESLYASAPVGLCFMDTEHRIVMINDFLAALNAIPARDHIGHTLPELLGELGEQFERAYRRVLETGRPLIELEESDAAPGTNGVLRHWLSSYYPVWGPDGALMGVHAVVLDMTERKQLQQRERDHREMFRALFDAAGDAHLLVAYGAGFVSANQAAADLFGFGEPAEMLDESPASVSPPRQPNGQSSTEMVLSHMRQALRTGRAQFNWLHQRRDGTTFHADVLMTRVDIGGVGIMQATVRDISERVAAEAALRATGAQLKEALQLAEQASRTKGEFLANMSHELRTPMNAIVGLASLLEESPLGPKEQRHVARIRTAARSLLRMLTDLLDYSRLDAAQIRLERIPFRLDEVLDNICALSTANAWSKGVEPVFAVAPDVPQHLVGDPLRLEQVLLNLFGNAVKFTECGEIVLQVAVTARASDSAEISFTVRDTGIGIAPEVQGRVFDAFTQADSSTVRKYGGTGLGLSIARKLVELAGGQLRLESVPGVGTAFHFATRFGIAAPPQEPAALLRQQQRVLVVDDNPSARQALVAACAALQWQVDQVATGEAMLERCTSGPYDIILVDSALPDMDGVAAISRARELRAACTAHFALLAPEPDAARFGELAPALGLNAIVSKPFTATALHGALAQLLGNAAPAAAPRPAGLNGRLQGMRVLLVEDNEINQEVAGTILGHAGASVEIAANGQAALSMLAERADYDVVLMDLQMPVMNGFEAARAIRARGLALPIVAMTANAMDEDREQALASGMQAHLLKPIDVNELVSTLCSVTGRIASLPDHCGDTSAPAQPAAPSVPGVDMKETLMRLGGSFTRFATLFRRFAGSASEVMQELRGHVDAGRRQEAAGVVHRLRGVAANLGARDVVAAALALESALRTADHATLLLRLAALEQALVAVAEAARHLDDTPPETVAPEPPPEQAGTSAEALAHLLQLLLNNNMKAIAETERLRSTLAACAGPERAALIADAVATLRFDEAARIMRALLTEMEET